MHLCTGEALDAGVPVAVCSTSNERAVSTIVRVLLGQEVAKKMRVFAGKRVGRLLSWFDVVAFEDVCQRVCRNVCSAGDIVPKKKPDPAIYLLAAQELNVDPTRYRLLGLGLG